VDAATAGAALHDATTALASATLPVHRATRANDPMFASYAGDPARALALGQVRACVASFYDAIAHALTLEHFWDERHVAGLVTQRPVVTAATLATAGPRDAWARAVEALGYGMSYGAAALPVVRAETVGGVLSRLLAAAEDVADRLAGIEPYLTEGVEPQTVAAAPAAEPVPAGARRQPRWGPAA
jgi:hypothetical protein